MLLKIRQWETFEKRDAIKNLGDRGMRWVAIPTKMDGEGYRTLVKGHRNGAAHFGAWIAMVEIAAKCNPRGTLIKDNGDPHDPVSLNLKSDIPASVFAEAIPLLLAIGWLELQPSQIQGVIETSGQHPDNIRTTSGDCPPTLHDTTLHDTRDASDKSAAPAVNGNRKTEAVVKPRRQPTGPHAELIAHYTQRWEDRYATKSPFTGKDAAHVKWILNQVADLEQAKRIVDAYFSNTDDFYAHDRHGLGLLVSQFRRFVISKPAAITTRQKGVQTSS